MNNTQLSKFDLVSRQINQQVEAVVKSNVNGFQMAFVKAAALEKISDLLTPEYMKPIMKLQGNRIGFKTDKDNNGGYPENIVKNCLIEATLTGVEPTGNQFNIIAGNTYITKEGFGYLLSKIAGLTYEIIPGLPRINQQKDGAAIEMTIKWAYGGEPQERKIDIPVKMNSFMGTDAVIGKATRKARAWLYSNITGSEISDGDAADADAAKTIPIQGVSKTKEEIEAERVEVMIEEATTIEQLEKLKPNVKPEQQELWDSKANQLINNMANGSK